MNYSNLFFSYEGRIGRKHFWAAQGALLVGMFFILATVPNIIFFLVMIAGIWCSLVLQIKRLNDLGKEKPTKIGQYYASKIAKNKTGDWMHD